MLSRIGDILQFVLSREHSLEGNEIPYSFCINTYKDVRDLDDTMLAVVRGEEVTTELERNFHRFQVIESSKAPTIMDLRRGNVRDYPNRPASDYVRIPDSAPERRNLFDVAEALGLTNGVARTILDDVLEEINEEIFDAEDEE